MEYKDYYKILGVDKNASTGQIKAAYRRLARKYHPDVNPGNKEAEAKFKEINEAHSVLNNPDKRKKYDELGSNWERVSRDQGFARQYAAQGAYTRGRTGEVSGFDFSDFFETFFGGEGMGGEFWPHVSPGRVARRSSRGADYEHEMPITLEEAFWGTKRTIRLQAQEICSRCQGNGIIATSSGRQRGRQVITSATPCPGCNGSGTISRTKTIDVKIPKGVTNGSRVRMAGQGGVGIQGGPNGDLYLLIKILPHRFFVVDDHNLKCELPVLDYEAVLGARVEMPSLSGKIMVKIPPETQSGTVLRLKGQGLPFTSKNRQGNLLVKIKIVIPSRISQEEKKLVEALKQIQERKGFPSDPRKNLM